MIKQFELLGLKWNYFFNHAEKKFVAVNDRNSDVFREETLEEVKLKIAMNYPSPTIAPSEGI